MLVATVFVLYDDRESRSSSTPAWCVRKEYFGTIVRLRDGGVVSHHSCPDHGLTCRSLKAAFIGLSFFECRGSASIRRNTDPAAFRGVPDDVAQCSPPASSRVPGRTRQISPRCSAFMVTLSLSSTPDLPLRALTAFLLSKRLPTTRAAPAVHQRRYRSGRAIPGKRRLCASVTQLGNLTIAVIAPRCVGLADGINGGHWGRGRGTRAEAIGLPDRGGRRPVA